MTTHRTRARKLWVPYGGPRWPPPRAVQLVGIIACALRGHVWTPWRVETEEWFEYIDPPVRWAWRVCHRCVTVEQMANDEIEETA